MEKSQKIQINELELLYQDNIEIVNFEKNLSKLLRLKVDPYVESVVTQYYLRELAGDHNDIGILQKSKKYLDKISTDYEIISELNKIEKNKNISSLKKKIYSLKKEANNVYSKINDKYQEYLEKSKQEKYCLLCNINYLHKLQLETMEIINNRYFNKIDKHIIKIQGEIENLKNILNDDEKYEEIIIKLINSQINVLNQQLEILNNH